MRSGAADKRYSLDVNTLATLTMHVIVKLFFVLASMSTVSVAYALEESRLPSHCKPGESTYLNAHMPELRYPQYETDEEKKTKPGWVLKKTGKILSICIDHRSKQLNSLIYRSGAPGMIELEKIATKSLPFYTFERFESVSGNFVIFFVAGQHTYCVSEATGQGSGISLTILKAGREVASFFSGNDQGVDYEAGLTDLPKTETLQGYKLRNKFQTPCDGKRLMRP